MGLHKNDVIVPIPGSRKLERIQENWAPPTST
jgi:aryl-alcohol dehydrogenase-like predicted oxidoreductase